MNDKRTAVASMCCRDCGEVLAVNDVPLSELPDFVASSEARGASTRGEWCAVPNARTKRTDRSSARERSRER